MVIVFDIGNTNVTLGFYEKDLLVFSDRFETFKSSDKYLNALNNLLRLHKIPINKIKNIVIGSVVPDAETALKSALSAMTDAKILTVTPNIDIGFNINIPEPKSVGADLIAGCSAAVNSFKLPCVIFDIGTAATVSIIDKDKNFISCLIMPGPLLSFETLAQRCALLPNVSLNAPVNIISDDTESCIRAGIVFTYASMVDGISLRVEEFFGEECTVIATGGLSNIILQQCRHKITCRKNLLLDGLYLLFKRNNMNEND